MRNLSNRFKKILYHILSFQKSSLFVYTNNNDMGIVIWVLETERIHFYDIKILVRFGGLELDKIIRYVYIQVNFILYQFKSHIILIYIYIYIMRYMLHVIFTN